MQALVKNSDQMQGTGWQDAYQDRFGQNTMRLRQQGLVQKLPDRLTPTPIHVQPKHKDDPRVPRFQSTVKDATGKEFDSLRGNNSTFATFHDIMRKSGGSSALLQDWMQEQGYGSWRTLPTAYKYYVATQGKDNTDEFFWHGGVEKAKRAYNSMVAQYGEETFRKTFDAYHAFTYELLMKTELPNVDRERGVATLWRTETEAAVGNAQLGDRNHAGKRGAAESTSLMNPVYVDGDILTRQEIPLINILGTYLTERVPGSGGYSFYGDNENEFISILGSTPFDYLAKGRPKL